MKINAIYFSTYVDDSIDKDKQLMMLHYALTTLSSFSAKGNFDTVVYYDGDTDNYDRLVKSFPFAIIKKFKFDNARYCHHYAFHKWTNLIEFADMQYDKVLYLDNDVKFNRDPSYIFNRYSDNCIYSIFDNNITRGPSSLVFDNNFEEVVIDGKIIDIHSIIGYSGINSGQMLFDRSHICSVHNVLCDESVINYRKIQQSVDILINDGILNVDVRRIVNWVGEQFAGQKVFIDNGIHFSEFSADDVDCSFDVVGKDPTILHYIGRENAETVIPCIFQQNWKTTI